MFRCARPSCSCSSRPRCPASAPAAASRATCRTAPARGLPALEGATWALAGAAGQTPGLTQAFTLFSTRTPQIWADIDRTKAEQLGVPIARVFETLSIYMGSAFVNDFNILGRTYRVTAQADNPYRLTVRDVANLKTRSASGEMVPIGSVATFPDTTGPYRVPRYNLYPGGRGAGRAGAAASRRARASRPWRGSPTSVLPSRLRLRMDRDRAAGKARRQHGRDRLRARRACSCSCCWRRSTRAGCCRSPSS